MRLSLWIKGTMLLTVAFAAGIAIGITYERRQGSLHASSVTDAHDAMHHLARELDLDPTQQRAIAEILAKHQLEVDATWHAMQPHMRATLDSTTQEILSVLRPDQAVKYRTMTEMMHSSPH